MLTNLCTRCGKERIASRTWVETVKTYWGESILNHTYNVCPDEDCQAKVDKALEANKLRLADIQAQKNNFKQLSKQKTSLSQPKAKTLDS